MVVNTSNYWREFLKRLIIKSYKLLSKIKVLHSIPGRLRVSIPGMKKLNNSGYEKYEDIFLKILNDLPGIENISGNYVSGTLLIEYSTEIISDKVILEWMEVTRHKLIDYFVDNSSKVTNDSENKIVKQLEGIIKAEVGTLNNGTWKK